MNDTQTDILDLDLFKDIHQRWLIEARSSFEAFAERAGASRADSVSIVRIISENLKSTADNLTDFIRDVTIAISRQLILNQLLCRMYAVEVNQRAIKSGIKAGLGKSAEHFDVEGLCGQVWMKLLVHLPTYCYEGPKQEAAYLREIARNVARNELATYRRRLTNAQKHQVDMERVLPYATSYEDKQEASPDPDRARPPE